MNHAIILLALLCSIPASSQTLDEALATFRAARFDESATQLEAVVAARPRDAQARAWLALNYRYLRRFDESIATARAALAIEPCNAFAHTVIADAYNRENSAEGGARLDSIWSHLMRAVACDSTQGDAWLTVWNQAIRRGDRAMERASLRHLYRDGFLTRGTLAQMRLVLRDLPKNAILLAGGDFDTYATLAIQQEEGFRTDVAVLSFPMLMLEWYARHARDRYGIWLPMNDKQLASFDSTFRRTIEKKGADTRTLNLRLLDAWLERTRTNTLGRPVALSQAYPLDDIGARQRRLSYKGMYYVFTNSANGPVSDTAATRHMIAGLVPSDFAGPAASDRDPSPYRLSAGNPASSIAYMILRYAYEIGSAGRVDEARVELDRVRGFAEIASNREELLRYIDDMRAAMDAEPGR